MHYANGRVAKNGDLIIKIDNYGAPVIGVLYNAVPGNDHCNGSIAPVSHTDPIADLATCLHVDDLKQLAGSIAEAPDTSGDVSEA